jgi:hypothetical protein
MGVAPWEGVGSSRHAALSPQAPGLFPVTLDSGADPQLRNKPS